MYSNSFLSAGILLLAFSSLVEAGLAMEEPVTSPDNGAEEERRQSNPTILYYLTSIGQRLGGGAEFEQFKDFVVK